MLFACSAREDIVCAQGSILKPCVEVIRIQRGSSFGPHVPQCHCQQEAEPREGMSVFHRSDCLLFMCNPVREVTFFFHNLPDLWS